MPPPKPTIADSIAVPKAAAASSAVCEADGRAIASSAVTDAAALDPTSRQFRSWETGTPF
jgi:hypothetical protein